MTGRARLRIGWVALGVAWLVLFAAMEGYALVHDDAVTLSRFTYDVSNAWPPIIFMNGLVVGILAEHFWRHVDIRFGFAPRVRPVVRYALLAIAWLIIILLTDAGPAVFLAGLTVGLLVTRVLWQWDPRDVHDRLG